MPVIKGVAYSLVHTPNILYHNGSTQVTEKRKNPGSEYLLKLKKQLRPYDAAVAYAPNQAYIGNIALDELRNIPRPWYKKPLEQACRTGKYGEILPEDEFYGLMKIVDSFELVILEANFAKEVKAKLAHHPLLADSHLARIGEGKDIAETNKLVDQHTAEGLYLEDRLVGCVRQAHEVDISLSAHVMLENLATKASSVFVVLELLKNSGIPAADISYIIECSEEACGDMNQRGGGNFAKAIAEIAGLTNATGSDIRGFCAGPSHALLQAASLVQSGVFDNVVVVGGGCVAKLGMNGRDHVAKGIPALEDVLGSFALLISKDDGISPRIRLDVLGKHNVGTGSAPQQVMKALVADPLGKLNMKITDVDYYSVEMQNPEITEPAGAGNVPEANYKMIAALAVLAGEIARTDIPDFIKAHGLPGFAPTQGHIPSGVPLLGFIRDQMLAGNMTTAMLIGKGSLFLGRMTNLFDGLSIIIEKNSGLQTEEAKISKDSIRLLVAEALRDMAKSLG